METPESFEFPFAPYDIQSEFMKNMYYALESGKLGIFESPTGTGKSLSIICSAIRWLKDYNKMNIKKLEEQDSQLQVEKEIAASNNVDWLSSQTKEIEITRKLHSVKMERLQITNYNKKIESFTNLNKQRIKRKFLKAENFKKSIDNELSQDEKNIIEDEDLILEDVMPNSEYLSDEEEEENYQPIKIYICSRTHSQLSQFVGEIRKSPFRENVRVTTLSSRQNYCINPEVVRLKNVNLINERCLDLQKKSNKNEKSDAHGKVVKKIKSERSCQCPYYKSSQIEELRDYTLSEVLDIEDLVLGGKEIKACPYYASRKAAEDAEIVLIPYNTLLHKATREANGIKLKNNVVIIDEAHNLLEALAQMYSSEINYCHVYHSLYQLKQYKNKYNCRFSAQNLLSLNQLIFVVSQLLAVLEKEKVVSEIINLENFVLMAGIDNYNMFKIVKFCKESRIAQKIRSFAMKYPEEQIVAEEDTEPKKGVQNFLASIEIKKKHTKLVVTKKQTENTKVPLVNNPLLPVISFLESLTYSYEDGRILITKKEDKTQSKIQFLLLNASSNFKDIIREARSVIVAGGTMKPNSEFRDRLFLNSGALPEKILEFSCDHIIPKENIMPIIINKVNQDESLIFNYQTRTTMDKNLISIISQACKVVKGGIVVFFPSYNYEQFIWKRIENLNFGRSVFREPQSSGSVESVLQKYKDAIRKPASSNGALLLSVVGGKLSEGLNFSDDLGRCIMVVGLPYANVTALDLKEKMTYLDKTEGFGAGKRFYENMCMKSVNQCIGRAVRHKSDYATVLLLDERYNRSSVKNSLPNWIKKSLKVCNFKDAFENITKFFENKNAL